MFFFLCISDLCVSDKAREREREREREKERERERGGKNNSKESVKEVDDKERSSVLTRALNDLPENAQSLGSRRGK